MKKKLGIYARQSREKDTDNSIEDQVLHGKAKAKELGLDYKIYIDRGETAAKDNFDNRPEFQLLLQDIQEKKIESVYVIDLSRLTRNEQTNFLIKQAFKLNQITIYTMLDGTVNYSDPTSVLINDIKNIFAYKLVQDTSLKIQSVLRKRVSEGKAHGSAIKPFGYKSDINKMLVIDEEEAEVVREIYALCINGGGSGAIAKSLNQKGVLTKTQKHYLKSDSLKSGDLLTKSIKWAPNTVLSILKNPIYKGERLHKGETFSSPKIVTNDTWSLAQKQIKLNTNSPGLSKHAYLLKNLCYCDRCGSKFCGRTRDNKKDHIYYCSSKVKNLNYCGIRGINIDTLESVVWFMISKSEILINKAREEVDNIKKPEYLEKLKQEKLNIESSINQNGKNKTRIIDLLKKELLTDDEAEKELKDIIKEITHKKELLKDLNLKLEEGHLLTKQIDDVEEFINEWGNLVFCNDFQLQYTLVRLFVEKVVISFDDFEEIYTVKVFTKLPNINELLVIRLNKSGEFVNENTSKPKENKEAIIRKLEKDFNAPDTLDVHISSIEDFLSFEYQKEQCDIRNCMMRRSKRSSGQ